MNRLIIVVLVLFCGMSYAAIEESVKRKQVKKLLKSRPQFTETEFAEHYFSDRQPVALTVRRVLAKQLSIDLAGLSPTDRLTSDLHIEKFSKTAMLEFVMAVEEDFNILLPDSKACEDLSIEEFVNIISEKVEQSGS
jgi:acyl carrier protein